MGREAGRFQAPGLHALRDYLLFRRVANGLDEVLADLGLIFGDDVFHRVLERLLVGDDIHLHALGLDLFQVLGQRLLDVVKLVILRLLARLAYGLLDIGGEPSIFFLFIIITLQEMECSFRE